MEKYKDKDFLFTECIVKDRTAQAIGNDFGVSKTTILKYLKRFDIKKPIEKHDYEDKDFLFSEYIVKNRSAKAIADDCGVAKHTILSYLKKFDIKKDKEAIILAMNTTNKIRYGEKRESLNEKRKKTNLEKYGTEFPTQNKTVREKIKQTNLQRYGVEEAGSSKIIRKKIEDTCLQRYGAKTNLMVKEYRDKAKETCLKKYGTEYAQQCKKYKEEHSLVISNTIFKSYESGKEYLCGFKEKPTISQLAEILSCSETYLCPKIHSLNLEEFVRFKPSESHYERDVVSFIKELGITNIQTHKKDIFEDTREEIDIFLPDYNIAIEINGTYWHSSAQKTRSYHFNKSKRCEALGIRLIHIWDYEWDDEIVREKIKMLLRISLGKVEEKIYARECTIREITNKEAKVLNDKVHLQGHRDAQVTYGLFYKDELVQLMSFSKTKYNRNLNEENSWEIIRGCPGSNNIVIGGVSKLFSHFIKDYKPSKVFSYCDFNKFNGVSYEKIGMKFIDYTGPDMKYVIDGKVYNRNPKKYKEYNKRCQYKLYGSGSKKYVWTQK